MFAFEKNINQINFNIKPNHMNNKLTLVVVIFLSLVLFSACSGHRDCQGNRHRIKTSMGGYM